MSHDDSEATRATGLSPSPSAIDLVKLEEWERTQAENRKARRLTAISAFIAAAALLVNALNSFETVISTKYSKRTDVASAWCRDITSSQMLDLQDSASDLRDTAYSRENATKLKFDYMTASPEQIISFIADRLADEQFADKVARQLSDNREEIDRPALVARVRKSMKALVGMLDFFENGAKLVLNDKLDRKIYQACFQDYTPSYFNYFDKTLIGVIVAKRNAMPTGPLDDTASAFFTEKNKAMQKRAPEQWYQLVINRFKDYFAD